MTSLREIAGVLARMRNPELMQDFLICMLTRRELEELTGRWELVKLLDQGMSQRKIAEKLGMSLCKITRGSKELKKENSALKKVLENYL
jgi:TrpR family trp operon transcriptional repressor